MAKESCNLDKEETEILKPSSSPSSTSSSSSSSSSSPSHPSLAPSSSPPPSSSSSPPPPLFLKTCQEFPVHRPERQETPPAALPISAFCTPKPIEESRPSVQLGNRCSSCRKRVGLTAFRCRCGDLFCARHRYSDTHDCSFDYKAAAREQISRANPVIRAAKIIKI